MKKVTKNLVSAALILSICASFAGCGSKPDTTRPNFETSAAETLPAQQTASSQLESTPMQEVETLPAEPTQPMDPVSMDDALFIGDSRVVGLMEYSKLDADFFAGVGMSVYNIDDEPVSVPNVGRMTLDELLSNKSYGKIYLMLGINELGYELEQTVTKYGKLVDSIRSLQPDAKLFIMGNLHVTLRKSAHHDYITNENISNLNDRISKLADDKDIFYMDVNPEFDDSNGALSERYTSDGVHLLARHYVHWGEWIAVQSAYLLKEG